VILVRGRVRQRLRYAARRFLQAIPILLAIVTCNFFLLHLAPGDAASVLAGESGSASEEYVAQLRHDFGLEKPLVLQYVDYVANVATLNFGYSFRYNRSNLGLIVERLGATLLLMVASFALAISFGILLGAWAATHKGRALDRAIRVLAVVAYAAPVFWVALMLIVVFALQLGILPTSGMQRIGSRSSGLAAVLDVAQHLILPSLSLSLFYLAVYTRLMRAALLDQLGMNYTIVAEAKGASPRQVLWRYAFRNAIIPVVTLAGLHIGSMLGGSVIVESVFGWPGLGLLAYQALFARDLNLLLGILIFSSVLVVVMNLLVDVVNSFVDPRIQLK
jgi:peptide/nickel transport system permease protein